MTPQAWAEKLKQAYRRQTPQGRVGWWVAGLGVAAVAIYFAATSGGDEAGQPNMTALALSVTLKLVFILALIYASLALVRHWQGTRLAVRQKQIAVVETVRLSPRQAIHLVRAGDQMLLIGATDAGLSLLSDLEMSAAPAPAAAVKPALAVAEFASLLPAPNSNNASPAA